MRPYSIAGIALVAIGILFYSQAVSPLGVVVREYGNELEKFTNTVYHSPDGTKLVVPWGVVVYERVADSSFTNAYSFLRLPIENAMPEITRMKFRTSWSWWRGNDDLRFAIYSLTKEQYEDYAKSFAKTVYFPLPSLADYKLLREVRVGDLPVRSVSHDYDGSPVKNFVLEIDLSPTDRILLFYPRTRVGLGRLDSMRWKWIENGAKSEWHQIIIEGKDYYKLFGNVYNAKTGKPLEGVSISAGSSYWTTDNTGYYELLILENTPTTVRFQKVGFEQKEISVVLTENKRMDIYLSGIECPTGDLYVNGQKVGETIYLATRNLTFTFRPTKSAEYIKRVYIEIQGQSLDLVKQQDGSYSGSWTAPSDGTYSVRLKLDWPVQTGVTILSFNLSLPGGLSIVDEKLSPSPPSKEPDRTVSRYLGIGLICVGCLLVVGDIVSFRKKKISS